MPLVAAPVSWPTSLAILRRRDGQEGQWAVPLRIRGDDVRRRRQTPCEHSEGRCAPGFRSTHWLTQRPKSAAPYAVSGRSFRAILERKDPPGRSRCEGEGAPRRYAVCL